MKYFITFVIVLFTNSVFAQSQTTVSCEVKEPGKNKSYVVEIIFPAAKINAALDAAVKARTALPVKAKVIGLRDAELLLSVSYFGFEPDMYKAVGASEIGIFELTYDFWAAHRLILEYKLDSSTFEGSCQLKP